MSTEAATIDMEDGILEWKEKPRISPARHPWHDGIVDQPQSLLKHRLL